MLMYLLEHATGAGGAGWYKSMAGAPGDAQALVLASLPIHNDTIYMIYMMCVYHNA